MLRFAPRKALGIAARMCRASLDATSCFAACSSAHRWLKRWQEDGTLEQLQSRVLGIAQNQGMINWNYGAIDGSFSPWKRWR